MCGQCSCRWLVWRRASGIALCASAAQEPAADAKEKAAASTTAPEKGAASTIAVSTSAASTIAGAKQTDKSAEPAASPAGKPDVRDEKASPPAADAKSGDTAGSLNAGEAAKTSEPPKTAPAAPAEKPAAAGAAVKPVVKMPPPKGSHLKDDDNGCVQCHTNPIAWDENDKAQYRFYLALDPLKKDVHFQKGVNCVDCHGGDPTQVDVKAHQANDDFRPKLPEIQKFCAYCHEKDVALLNASPHKIAAGDVPRGAARRKSRAASTAMPRRTPRARLPRTRFPRA